jgi:hypothetical protein
MSQLPRSISEALLSLSATEKDSARVASGVATLLEAEQRCGDASRGIEAFREAARVLGILEESRNGQRIYDAWCKLTRFFVAPLGSLKVSLDGENPDLVETPGGFEALGALWERTRPELAAFVEEQETLDRVLQESPISTHVGYRVRSRLCLLDQRAERAKVALDLLRNTLGQAARRGAEDLKRILGKQERGGGSGRPKQAGGKR